MTSRMVLGAALGMAVFLTAARAGDDTPAKLGAEQFTLRYKFRPGETLRWIVVHRCRIRTSVSGTTQNAETTTSSVKLWRVSAVKPDGAATFEHLVESVDMRHKLGEREQAHYNSRTDAHAPRGYETVAQAIGVPLSVVTMDAKGKIIERKRNKVKAAVASEGEMTIPLPAEPIAVGHQWSFPHDIEVPLPCGGIRRVQSLQSFKLEGVRTGIASIHMTTQILTPIHDPALESQLLQYESSGTVRFDIDAGRVLGQQMDVDRGVVGFRGEASSIHYLSRFTEDFLPGETKVAARAGR